MDNVWMPVLACKLPSTAYAWHVTLNVLLAAQEPALLHVQMGFVLQHADKAFVCRAVQQVNIGSILQQILVNFANQDIIAQMVFNIHLAHPQHIRQTLDLLLAFFVHSIVLV